MTFLSIRWRGGEVKRLFLSAPLSIAFVLVAIQFIAIARTHALEVPLLTGRIVDRAGVVAPETAKTLEHELAEYERKTGIQIAVLTVPSLEGDSLEEFSHRVATTWQLGQKGVDNGVLVVVVPQDRRLRIEVGYGLEGVLTDAMSARIIRHVMVPAFRQGDFSGGIAAGVRAIVETLERGEPGALPAPSPSVSDRASHVWTAVLLGALIGGVMFGGHLKSISAMLGGFVSFLIALPGGVLVAVGAALAAMVLGLILAGIMGAGPRGGRRGWRDGGLGPIWGAPGGGFPPTDIFSGRGGTFGGGGASGRW